jgi:hypothetical protein
VTDQTLDALRQVLAWLRELWDSGEAPDGADRVAELVARALKEEDAGG